MIYSKKEPLVLKLSDSDNPVEIRIDCYNGTNTDVAFSFEGKPIIVSCEQIKLIGNTLRLKGNSILFAGAAYNANDDVIRVTHTIKEKNGNEIVYTFPDDYDDIPPYEQSDDELPDYDFTVRYE